MIDEEQQQPQTQAPLGTRVGRLEIIIMGDPVLGLEGLLPRISRIEDNLTELLQ